MNRAARLYVIDERIHDPLLRCASDCIIESGARPGNRKPAEELAIPQAAFERSSVEDQLIFILEHGNRVVGGHQGVMLETFSQSRHRALRRLVPQSAGKIGPEFPASIR